MQLENNKFQIRFHALIPAVFCLIWNIYQRILPGPEIPEEQKTGNEKKKN